MNILFVAAQHKKGGAEKIFSFVITKLSSHEDNNGLFTFFAEVEKTHLPNDLEYLSAYNTIKKMNFFRLLFIITKLRKIIKDRKPQILIAFGVYNIFFAYLSSIFLNVKIIGSERRDVRSLPTKWKLSAKILYKRLDAIVYQLNGARLNLDKYRANEYIINNPYIRGYNYELKNTDIKSYRISSGAARLEYAKGFDILLESFFLVLKTLPNYELIIFGDGNYKQLYGELISRLDLWEKVKFPGYCSKLVENVLDTDLFVLPSRYEGIPNILLEVMAVGMPTVSFDCPPGGPRLLTDNGQRGLLVPVNDVEALAESIISLLKNTDYAKALSTEALKVREEFDEDRIGNQWRELVNNMKKEV